MLVPLPPSESKFWDGEKFQIDDIKELLCSEHSFILYKDKRELKCAKCGFGTRFTPSTIELSEKGVKFNNTIHKYTIYEKEAK